jgi:hypothetical protein
MPDAINIEVTQALTPITVSITVGIPGPGVAPGGTTGQVLAKASGTDYHTEWVNPETGGPGGAVSSVFGRTGAVTAQSGDYTADQVTESATRVFVTPTQKTDLHTHANKSILDSIQEALTTVLKTAYDSAVTWITTNGTNILNHLSNTSNPHSVTKSQVGLGNCDNTSDASKPVSSAQQTALDLKQNTITTSESVLASPVSMPSAATWYSGPDITLGVGTWEIFAEITIGPTNGGRGDVRIFNGTAAEASGSINLQAGRASSASIAKIVTVTSGTVTYTMQAYTNVAASTILHESGLIAQPNATFIYAKKIA